MTLDILFCGDFAPCRRIEKIVLEENSAVLGDALKLIQSADLSFVNLECPLTNSNNSINKSGPSLKANPRCIDAIKDFTVVGLANNHILDYGRQGLADTLQTCEQAEIPFVGAGLNLAQAQKPFIYESAGIRVAIIAIAEHEFNQSEENGAGSAPVDLIENFWQIKNSLDQADIVIVTLHGGNEYFPYPRPGLRKICQHYIDLGAHAVICHHAHVPGAYELYKDRPIVYSLGNFVFDSLKPPAHWNLGYMASLRFDKQEMKFSDISLIPYHQSFESRGIRLLLNADKSKLLEQIESYREILADHKAWLENWNEFVNAKSDTYILRQFFPATIRGLGFLARNTPLARLFYNKANSLDKLNLIRCQSHLELLRSILEARAEQRND